jgi:hypothetical protein
MMYQLTTKTCIVAIYRYNVFKKLLAAIENNEEGGLDQFTRGYENYGILARPDGSIYCKEWCPGAQQLYLYGDFSNYLPCFSSIKFLNRYVLYT